MLRLPHLYIAVYGDDPMILADKKLPKEILEGSVLVHLAAAYFHVPRRMEQKTKCSQTRGFVVATLRGGALLNQNQIATLLGLDRTVVHCAVKSLICEGLVSEKKAPSGRAVLLELTSEGQSSPFCPHSTAPRHRRETAPGAFAPQMLDADSPAPGPLRTRLLSLLHSRFKEVDEKKCTAVG